MRGVPGTKFEIAAPLIPEVCNIMLAARYFNSYSDMKPFAALKRWFLQSQSSVLLRESLDR